MLRAGAPIIHNANTNLVTRPWCTTRHGSLQKLNTFDMRQPKMRALFVADAVYGVRRGARLFTDETPS